MNEKKHKNVAYSISALKINIYTYDYLYIPHFNPF